MQIRPSAIKQESKNKENQRLRYPLLLNTIQRILKLPILPFSPRLKSVHIKGLIKRNLSARGQCVNKRSSERISTCDVAVRQNAATAL